MNNATHEGIQKSHNNQQTTFALTQGILKST
jgi:hypothetical protein